MQIGLYRNLLKSKDKDYKIYELTEVDDPVETASILLQMSQYLHDNPDTTILCDGSIATDIADDMANNMLSEDIWDKHQSNLQVYASMNQSFNIVNILLTPTNIDMCRKRLEKKRDIFGQEISELDNIEHLRRTANLLKTFDDNALTTNISFYNIQVDESDSMLEIHKKILDIISKA